MRAGRVYHTVDRVWSPSPPPAELLLEANFGLIGRATLGLVRGSHWRLRLGPLRLLEFDSPIAVEGGYSWRITGGQLARHPGGCLRIRWLGGQIVHEVEAFAPRLPGPVYRLTQLPLHHLVTRLILLRITTAPRPGPPPSVGALAGAGLLDAGVSAIATLGLPGRWRIALLPVIWILYTTVAWAGFGRTGGQRLLGIRLLARDGSRPTPAQAVIRMLALPYRCLRGGHLCTASQTLLVKAAGTRTVSPRLRPPWRRSMFRCLPPKPPPSDD